MKKRKNVQTTADARTLRHALTATRKIIPTRPANEVLRNVKLAEGTAEATDTEIRLTIPTDYQGPPMLVPGEKLCGILSSTDAEEIQIELEASSAIVNAARGSWRLPTCDLQQWPTAADDQRMAVCTVPADQLHRGIAAVLNATAKDDGRYSLGGVLLDLKDGVVALVATDGRRLHRSLIEIDQATDDCQIVIPARAANIISQLAHQGGDETAVQIDRTHAEIIVEIGDPKTIIRARLLEARFPDWRKVLPEQDNLAKQKTEIEADKLFSAIKQAAICSGHESKTVEIKWGDTCVISAQSSESGKSRIDVEPIHNTLHETQKLNPIFALDWLRTIDSQEPVAVEIMPSGAAVFSVEDSTAVIMPIEAS